MNDPATLTDRLGLAVAAGVPAAELERAGLSKNIEAQWVFTIATGPVYESEFRCDRIKGQSALFVFERVVIEWLGSEHGLVACPSEDGMWFVSQPERLVETDHRLFDTLSAALTAALRQIKEKA